MEKNRFVMYAGIASFWGIILLTVARHAGILEQSIALRWSAPFFLIAGIAILFAVFERHAYFIETAKYQFFARHLGERGAKIFYAIIGLFCFALGVFILLLPTNS